MLLMKKSLFLLAMGASALLTAQQGYQQGYQYGQQSYGYDSGNMQGYEGQGQYGDTTYGYEGYQNEPNYENRYQSQGYAPSNEQYQSTQRTTQGRQNQPYYTQGSFQNQPNNYTRNQYNTQEFSTSSQPQQYSRASEQSGQYATEGYVNNPQYSDQNTRGQNYAYQTDSSQKLASDAELNRKIREALNSDPLSSKTKSVSFTVSNGLVTLKGSVDSPQTKNAISEKIQEINGIKQVSNQIAVGTQGTFSQTTTR